MGNLENFVQNLMGFLFFCLYVFTMLYVASFSGPAQLSVACPLLRTASNRKLGGAWEQGHGLAYSPKCVLYKE